MLLTTKNVNCKLSNSFTCNKCLFYEAEISKLKKDLSDKDNLLKKLQQKLNEKNDHNTSSTFPLPSEFKFKWENFIKNSLIESFDNSFDDEISLAYVVQETMQAMYDYANQSISNKLSQILNFLNIPLDNSHEFFIYNKIKDIFQVYFTSVFQPKDINHQKIVSTIIDKINSISALTSDQKKNIILDVSSPQYKSFIQEAYSLNLYLNLHDPKLSICDKGISYVYYSKKNHINIDGFIKENTPCVVVLYPPLIRDSYYYKGIQPAVYYARTPTQDILLQCDKNIIDKRVNRCSSESDVNKGKLKCYEKLKISRSTLNLKNKKSKTRLFSINFSSKNNSDFKMQTLLRLKEKYSRSTSKLSTIHDYNDSKTSQTYMSLSFMKNSGRNKNSSTLSSTTYAGTYKPKKKKNRILYFNND